MIKTIMTAWHIEYTTRQNRITQPIQTKLQGNRIKN